MQPPNPRLATTNNHLATKQEVHQATKTPPPRVPVAIKRQAPLTTRTPALATNNKPSPSNKPTTTPTDSGTFSELLCPFSEMFPETRSTKTMSISSIKKFPPKIFYGITREILRKWCFLKSASRIDLLGFFWLLKNF